MPSGKNKINKEMALFGLSFFLILSDGNAIWGHY